VKKAALRDRLYSLSVEGLLWAMGLFCGFVGAFLLVAPHHFAADPYRALRPHSLAWGSLALASGVGLLAIAGLRPRRWVGFCVHLLAGLTLLALAASFGQVNALTGMLAYAILGLGTILASLSPRERPAGAGGDLFALLVGASAFLSGFLITLFPELFEGLAQSPFRIQLRLLALVFLVAGPLLFWVQLDPPLARWRLFAVHFFAGSAYLAFGLLIALPNRAWTGIALYCGGGAMIALLPWLRRRLAAVDTSALWTRFSLAMAIATSLALIVATAVVTAQEERLAEAQAIETQRIEARAIAQNVLDYVEMNGARTLAVAALAGRSPMTPEIQGRLLASSRGSYPEVVAFRTVNPDGGVVAAAGDIRIPRQPLRRLIAAMRKEGNPRIQLSPVTLQGRSLLLLAAPVRDDDGNLGGAVVAAFDSRALVLRIARKRSRVVLADGRGRLLATGREAQPAGGAAILPAGWDRQVRAGREVIVGKDMIAGFARVPVLEWAVAVERPREAALEGVRQGRDLAFGLLLLVVPLAVAGGIVAARRIARPLGNLAAAVDELTAGNLAAPLGPESGITEVARLAAAFEEMRARLAARTRESERLAAELRARADALAETDRRKDEFLAMLGHELRNPLGAIANASYLLERLGSAEPAGERAVAIIRRQIQHLVRMVDDLLDVSRITRGKVELRREPVDLVELVRNTVETTRPLAEAREQTLRMELPDEILPLHGDATRLEQVLSNLLRNAVKFTAAGGHVEISAWRDGGGEAVVLVRDDGIGIPPDLLPRVFDLFAQGEQALHRSGAGLGIGLTLVHRLVEMHGGRVEARSDGPGRGSELEVRLPLSTCPPAPPRSSAREPATPPHPENRDSAGR
jgi:signal transduction histidine kinase